MNSRMLVTLQLTPAHTDAFVMRCVAIRHDASMYMHGRIATDRNATHEKRIRVGRAQVLLLCLPPTPRGDDSHVPG